MPPTDPRPRPFGERCWKCRDKRDRDGNDGRRWARGSRPRAHLRFHAASTGFCRVFAVAAGFFGQDAGNPRTQEIQAKEDTMDIQRIAVIGAGQMGQGIAQVAAQSGFHVHLVDISDEVLQRALGNITHFLNRDVERGRATREDADAALARLQTTTDLAAAAAQADAVIEAVPENLALKKETFAAVDAAAPDAVLLASNTSTYSITE